MVILQLYDSIGFRKLSQPMVWVVLGYWRPFIGLLHEKGGVFEVTETAISRIFGDLINHVKSDQKEIVVPFCDLWKISVNWAHR